jgi:TolB-like protein/DNA-binding winged helix-turn-helix (wHTH) protein/tetratricopeptide (TPR) repeat protein
LFLGYDLMSPAPDPMRIGEWLADPRDDSLSRGSERVKLEPRTMRLLMRLALTPGSVVSQDELLESVWSGVVVSPASVYQSMSQLRKVLGDTDDPPHYIETVARKGYRLVAKVSKPDKSEVARIAEAAPDKSTEIAPAPPAQVQKPRGRRWLALAAAVVLVAATAWWQLHSNRPPLPQTPSIVVLPFVDLTDGHTQQMFCDGLTEETSNWLAQVPSLRVVARSSAFAYRDRQADVRAIGRELNISHVLEGSLRRSGNKMRITVQLIDTNTGFHLWSENYNVEAGDVLRVQESVARNVAGSLELRISSETNSRFDGRRSKNGPAQELFLNAQAQALKFDSVSNDLAIALYRQALRSDPDFALAKVYLAKAIGNQRYFKSQLLEDLLPEILPLLAEAEKSAPQLADVYAVRGNIYVNLGRRELAQRDLKKAIDLNPNGVEPLAMMGRFHLVGGEPRDALSYYTITAALDPKDFGWPAYRCIALADMARFDEAESACAQARMLGPSSPWVYSVSSSLEESRGRMDEALKYSAASIERDSDIAAHHSERARWLGELGLMKESGAAFREAVAANPAAARRSNTLMYTGATAALATGGAKGLRSYVEEFDLTRSDDPKLQFELANAWLTVGDYNEAGNCINRAKTSTKFNSADLDSPWLARTSRSYLLISALVSRAKGENAAAEQDLAKLEKLLARMEDAGVRRAGVYDLKGQLAALRGRGDEAVASLRRAVDLGWSSAWIAEHEPYFASVHDRADFRALLAAVTARNAVTAAKLKEQLKAPQKPGA